MINITTMNNKENYNTSNEITPNKKRILTHFFDNVKDVNVCLDDYNKRHCGKEGHWLENRMGIKHNSNNQPDINGYEMKVFGTKTTLGDFSASEYIFSGKNRRTHINMLNNWSDDIIMNRQTFIKTFGTPNPNKNNRYSWSGSCVPTFGTWNHCGQTLTVSDNNDIVLYYSYSKDTRTNKHEFDDFMKHDNIVYAIWLSNKLKNNIENKFNSKGFFVCKKQENKYSKICFGKAFNFDYFIECIKNKKIKFDSGMYEGNNRNYSQFRGSCFWNELIYEEH